MEDDEEDIYAPHEGGNGNATGLNPAQVKPESSTAPQADGDEEGEEGEEEDSDSDIDIITERQDAGKPDPVAQAPRANAPKSIAIRIESPLAAAKGQPSPALKVESTPGRPSPAPSKAGSSYPPYKISTIDVNAKPIFEPTGKPITEVDMDADFPEDDKPWRRPGTDTTDFFNYGFDEFTWASYCLKQESLRKEIVDGKKQMEEMQSFLGMSGAMPGIPGPAAGAQAGMPSMGGMGDMPPDLQQMMQQMMASGMDPSQMDFNTFTQMMSGGQGGMGGGQGFGQQGQNQQQMGYGYGGGGGGGQGGGGGNRNQARREGGRRW